MFIHTLPMDIQDGCEPLLERRAYSA